MFKVYQPSWLKIVCVSSAGKGVCEAWNPKFVCCKMSSAWCKSCVWLKGLRWQSMNHWLQMEPFLLAWEQKRVLQTSASAMEQHPPICGANSFISTSLASCVLGELSLLWLGLCRQDCVILIRLLSGNVLVLPQGVLTKVRQRLQEVWRTCLFKGSCVLNRDPSRSW